jgi:hypothetical protein
MTAYLHKTAYSDKLEEARHQATSVCHLNGDDHEECIEAWETLEMLEGMDECTYEVIIESLEPYCAIHPDAQECRILPGWRR